MAGCQKSLSSPAGSVCVTCVTTQPCYTSVLSCTADVVRIGGIARDVIVTHRTADGQPVVFGVENHGVALPDREEVVALFGAAVDGNVAGSDGGVELVVLERDPVAGRVVDPAVIPTWLAVEAVPVERTRAVGVDDGRDAVVGPTSDVRFDLADERVDLVAVLDVPFDG